jgi:ribonuclease R
MNISEKEREASSIEQDFMARKFARWAEGNIDKEFKARISGTDPELKADLLDEIQGARLQVLTTQENVVLFEDVIVEIQKVDIAQAKIFVQIISKVDN